MSIIFWFIMILAAWNARGRVKGIHEDYISLERIQPIKGIFLLLVFVSHFVQYMSLSGVWHAPYFAVKSWLGQLVVVPFLFYSGFGITESIRKKGLNYVKKMPTQRILKTLFQFDLAVLLFLICRLAMGKQYDLKTVLLTFVGWAGIGNSNWYIFAILFLYAFTWLAYRIFSRNAYLPLVCTTALTVGFVLVMREHRDGYWYNTVMAYVAGMWFSQFKKPIDRILSNDIGFVAAAALVWGGLMFTHKYWWDNVWIYQATAILFGLLIVLATTKIQVTNRFLAYCGEHLFSLFILQRLPMLVLDNTILERKPYVYFAVCFVLTFILSKAFDAAAPWLWNKLTVRKAKA